MMTLSEAIDRYDGTLARRGRSEATRRVYFRYLSKFADGVPSKGPDELELEDYERFIDQWSSKSASTLAMVVSLVKGFSTFLHEHGLAEADVAHSMRRPPRKRPEELDVVGNSAADVRRLLDACWTFQEYLTIAVLVYLGPRRSTAARLRWSDVDLERGTVRFLEKGRKVALKPLPQVLWQILSEVAELGVSPDDYVIPNRRPASVTRRERSDKVIYETVRAIGKRAGVRTHVHALRAAFAVHYLETHPGDLEALQALLGHTRPDTTQVYLRKLNRMKSMERVRDLDWRDSGFKESSEEAHTGFEPVLPP